VISVPKAPKNNAKTVAKSTQQILQASINVLWKNSDDTCEGLGPIATLERELNVSKYVGKQLVEALEHIGHLEWTRKRGMGALYYVDPKLPTISLSAAKRVLSELGAPLPQLKVA
jgi:hypothetical protein